MRPRSRRSETKRRFQSYDLMRDELSHALVEALYELEVLPRNEDGALMGLYAVMDDIQDAVRRAERLDPAAEKPRAIA